MAKRTTKARWAAGFALGAAICATGWFGWFAGPRTPRGLLALREGIHAYDLKLDTTLRNAEGEIGHFALSGVLKLQHHEVRSVVARLEAATLTSRFADAPALEQMRAARPEFAKPLVIEFERDGRISVVREDASTRAQVRGMVKAVMAMLQFVEPSSASLEWQTSEQDTSGDYSASYSEQDYEHAQKHKTAYTELRGLTQQGLTKGANLIPMASKLAFAFDTNGQPKLLTARESIKAEGELLGGITTTTTLKLTFRGHSTGRLATAAELSTLDKAALYEVAQNLGFSAEADRARIGGRSFEELLADAERMPIGIALQDVSDDEERKSLHNFLALAALFRLDNSAVEDALERLEDGSKAAPRLWDALGAAGTPKAQEALRRLIEMPDWERVERHSQMISLSMVQRPTKETVDFLVEHFDDPNHGEQARYGVGTAAHNLAKIDPAAADEAFGHLTRSLEETEDRHKQAHLLRAIGNAGHRDGLAAAKPYLESSDNLVRAGAANALRQAPQTEAAEDLRKLATEDPDPFVRRAAIRAIEDRGVSEWSVGVLDYVARNDASGILREQALSVLSRFSSIEPSVSEVVARIVADAKAASET